MICIHFWFYKKCLLFVCGLLLRAIKMFFNLQLRKRLLLSGTHLIYWYFGDKNFPVLSIIGDKNKSLKENHNIYTKQVFYQTYFFFVLIQK